MAPEESGSGSGILSAWAGIVRRRWAAGLAIFVGVFALSAWLVLSSRPVYRAESRLRLGEPPPMSGVSPSAGIFGLFQLGGDPFANDLELLLSRTLLERVVSDASLNATLVAPAGWYRDSIFDRFSAGGGTARATFELSWTDAGVRVRMTSPRDSLVAMGPPGSVLSFGDLEVIPRPLRPRMPRKVEIRTVPHGEAVRLLTGRLVIERARREANVVQISFNHDDPELARHVVNTAVERFIEFRTAIQRRESGQTVDSLRAVANETLAELNLAEREMEALQRRIQLVAPDAQNQAFIERYSEVVAQLESARAEFAGITTLLARVESLSNPAEGWADLAAYPAFLQNETVGELLIGLNRLDEQRMELASRRTTASREHQVLIEQIARRDASIRAIAVGYQKALEERIRLAEAQVAGMQRFLAGIPQQVIEYGRHQRNVRVLSEVVVLTEQRLRQEELRQALTFANVQVIDPPAVLFKPVWPRKRLGLGVGFLVAAMFGTLALVVTDRADRTVRRARDVRTITRRPILAVAGPGPAGEFSMSEPEVRSILRGNGRTAPHACSVAVVATGTADAAEAVAARLRASLNGDAAGERGLRAVRVMSADSFSAAAAVDAPAVLIVVCGRTARDELQRATEFLRQNGGEILGTVLICPRAADERSLWE